MKKILQFIGYICGFLFGYYGTMALLNKLNKKNRTYFEV